MHNPGDKVQFSKSAIINSTGSIDDLYGIVLGTVEALVGPRVLAVKTDRVSGLIVYVLKTEVLPFPLSR
jgi:hypothetical protein